MKMLYNEKNKLYHFFHERTIVLIVLIFIFIYKNNLYLSEMNQMISYYEQINFLEIITISLFLLLISLSKKFLYKTLMYLFLTLTNLLYVGNLIYYKNYNDVLSFSNVFQLKQVGDVTYSIFDGFSFIYILFFIDIITFYLMTKYLKVNKSIYFNGKELFIHIFVLIACIVLNISIAANESNLSEKYWNIKPNLEMGNLTYHLGESFYTINKFYNPPVITKDELIIKEEKLKNKTVKNDLNGLLKDKNIVFIQWETLSQKPIHMNIDGKDIMPNLKEIYEKSYHNTSFLNTVSAGHSSDSEFLTIQSMYNYQDKAVSIVDDDKDYNTLIHLLKKNDYYSFSMHNYIGSFWNRETIHPLYGFDESVFLSDVDQYVKEAKEVDKQIDWGLTDDVLYTKMHEKINEVSKNNEKFVAYGITVQNHEPFKSGQFNNYYIPYESDVENIDFNNYFTSLNETDDYFGKFMKNVSKEEWFNDTIFVIYADHDLEMSIDDFNKFYHIDESKNTFYDHVNNEMVPFMIYSPIIDLSSYNEEYGDLPMNHIDIAPSLMQLMGIDTTDYLFFGKNIFNKEIEKEVYHVNGMIMNEDFYYLIETYPNSKHYQKVDRKTGIKKSIIKEDIHYINKKVKEARASQHLLNNNQIINEK